jgi:hypothetical protein
MLAEVTPMQRKKQAPRPSDVVMDELVGDQAPWDLEKHLTGCLVGYQTDGSYGAAVYFALEALSGIAQDVAVSAKDGGLNPDQLDADWIISPSTRLPVPWIWIRALGEAWERYKTEGGPLGRAFGLEGGGQGKSPTGDRLLRMLDERAIVRWISAQLEQARAAHKKIRIEDLIQEAAEKFGKSDVTIRRIWQRFRRRQAAGGPRGGRRRGPASPRDRKRDVGLSHRRTLGREIGPS